MASCGASGSVGCVPWLVDDLAGHAPHPRVGVRVTSNALSFPLRRPAAVTDDRTAARVAGFARNVPGSGTAPFSGIGRAGAIRPRDATDNAKHTWAQHF